MARPAVLGVGIFAAIAVWTLLSGGPLGVDMIIFMICFVFALVASGSGRAADRPFVGGQRPFGAPRMTLPD